MTDVSESFVAKVSDFSLFIQEFDYETVYPESLWNPDAD